MHVEVDGCLLLRWKDKAKGEEGSGLRLADPTGLA